MKPSFEVTAILNTLLDIYERRELARREAHDEDVRRQAIKVKVNDEFVPGYFSQTDPAPRALANLQLQQLERVGVIRLDWLRGERGHLLSAITLDVTEVEQVYDLLGRASLASKRRKLIELLLSERARYRLIGSSEQPSSPHDWRIRALSAVIHHLRDGKSPAPFSLNNSDVNADMCIALHAIADVTEETPRRIFSVRVFNDSKRFEHIAPKLMTLAKRGNPTWRSFTREEVLRELNLVANPTHLFLFGNWELVDAEGQVIVLGGFAPSVGLPSAQAARLKSARVMASRVICVENLTSFYELARLWQSVMANADFAAICLMGNPSPACRHLLRSLTRDVPLFVWADMDYGGFNILAQIRNQVNAEAQPIWMDETTFDRHAMFARPLTPVDVKHLTRLMQRPRLEDVRPALSHMLARGLKLEQEAISMDDIWPSGS